MGIIKSFEYSQPTTCIPSTRFTSEVNHLHTNHHYAYHKTHHYSQLRRSHEPSHRQIEAHDYHYHHNNVHCAPSAPWSPRSPHHHCCSCSPPQAKGLHG